MDDERLSEGFLQPVVGLNASQIGGACEAAFSNAVELLEEADVLRGGDKCARAYFLTHIACEELGKLPILTALAASLEHGLPVEWKKIDRALRSHASKIKQVLFMDSVVGHENDVAAGAESYEEDLKRLRTYTDMKNASLYSFYADGSFHLPSTMVTCEFFDTFYGLARGRLNSFEAMYMRPIRSSGGLDVMLDTHRERVAAFLDELQHALDQGDEPDLDAMLERLLRVREQGTR